MRSRGDNGAPLVAAGQATWHRPHFVHASRSSSCFQVKSSIVCRPKWVPDPAGVGAGRLRDVVGSWTTRFAVSVTMCMALENGM
ncbi:MAG: hypothetical protein FD127_3036 [Acidimicrobiaceae bacterium]|nr:MAG: hypothetical protein FD127_3036 [Acidimicrobiaceae bacterium]